MNNKPKQDTAVKPPKMIDSIVSGFNTVASNIYLILLPIILDIMLLFGPKLSLKNVLGPYMEKAIQNLYSFSSGEMIDLVEMTREVWNVFINEYNFLSLIRTFPIGIPSLLAGQLFEGTPTGNTTSYTIKHLV